MGLAVNCLANIVTKDLARDLIGDVLMLIGHSKPYVRKKSVLSMYKIYVKYPQGLRLTFDKLKEVSIRHEGLWFDVCNYCDHYIKHNKCTNTEIRYLRLPSFISFSCLDVRPYFIISSCISKPSVLPTFHYAETR